MLWFVCAKNQKKQSPNCTNQNCPQQERMYVPYRLVSSQSISDFLIVRQFTNEKQNPGRHQQMDNVEEV
jgi:hypothetical protein